MRLSSLAFTLCLSLATTLLSVGCDLGDEEVDSRFLEVAEQEADKSGDGEPTGEDPCGDPTLKEKTPGCGDGEPTGECKLDDDGTPDCSDPACIDLCKK